MMALVKKLTNSLNFRFRAFLLALQSKKANRIKIQASQTLESKPFKDTDTIPFSIACFVGKNQFLDLLFALRSFEKVVGGLGKLYVLSDGTVTEEQIATLYTLKKDVKFYPNLSHLVEDSPENIPPILLEFCASSYKIAPKLLLGHVMQYKDNCLLMDSDIVWFSNPFDDSEFKALLNEGSAFYMKDEYESHDLEVEEFSQNNGFKPKRFVNSGLLYLPLNCLAKIDWAKVIPAKKDYGFFAEQTAFGAALSLGKTEFLPNRYLVSLAGVAFPQSPHKPFEDIKNYDHLVCRHFVSPVRNLMWLKAYRQLSKSIK